MITKKLKTKTHRLSMGREELIFALFAFRKVYAHGRFVSIVTRLRNALEKMGLDPYCAEFDEATEQYENLFEPVPDYIDYLDTI